MDNAANNIVYGLKCMPEFARWFGETTRLGDENTYKANTEEIERLNELQEGIHNYLKENSGDEETFELMTETMQYATMVAAVAEIVVGAVVAAPKICKYIIENGKKIKELVGNSKKLTSKIEGLIDDFNKIIKETKKSSSNTQGEIKEKVLKNIEDSKKARESSGYKELVDDVEKSANKGGSKTKGVSNPNKYCLSGEEHYESLNDLFGADNVKWETKASKYDNAVFADDEKLVSHYWKHRNEFGAYSLDDYLNQARNVMNNGYEVNYLYKGEIRTGFLEYYGTSKKNGAKFAFVGTNNEGFITTFHTESGKTFWKMLNGENIKIINPK